MSKAIAIMQRLELAFLHGIDIHECVPCVQWQMLDLCAWLLHWGEFLILAESVEQPVLLHETVDIGDVLSSKEEQETGADGH